MSQQDQHLTTEQLSAFLDQQLTPEEQASCSAHLQDCKPCQSVLGDLQQTVNLLRSLPQLEVPRSFALPADFNITSYPNLDTHNSQMDHEIETQANGKKQRPVEQSTAIIKSSPSRLPTALRRTLRVVSALAAVIGLFFVLSGLIATLQPRVTSMSTTATFSPQPPLASSPKASNDSSTPVNRAENQHQNSYAETKPTATGPILPFLDFNQPGVRLSLGILLAIVGSIGFRLFAQRLNKEHSQ